MDQAFTVELPVPWDRESPMTRELLVDNSCNGKNRFHCIDPWHALHLGIGKAWVASGIMMLQHLVPETQVDKRMRAIGAEYRSFCRRQKLDPVIRRIDIHSFGGGGANEANGTWNKAAVTSNFMMFLQEFCEQRAAMVEGDERLRIFVSFWHMPFEKACCSYVPMSHECFIVFDHVLTIQPGFVHFCIVRLLEQSGSTPSCVAYTLEKFSCHVRQLLSSAKLCTSSSKPTCMRRTHLPTWAYHTFLSFQSSTSFMRRPMS